MSFGHILLFGVLLIGTLLFSLLNPTKIPIHLSSSTQVELPLIVILLLTFLFGVVLAFILNLVSNSKTRFTLFLKYHQRDQLHKALIKGLEYYCSDRQIKAIPLLKKVLEKDSSKTTPLALLGNIYRSQKKFEKAVYYHEKAKALAPKDKFVLKNLEEDYKATKNLSCQKEVVKELTIQDNNNLDNLMRLRELHAESENWNDAIDVQKQIIPKVKEPDKLKEEKRRASIFYHESALEAFDNDFLQTAIQKLKKSIKADSKFTASHMLAGEAYLKLGHDKKALIAWELGYQQTEDPLFLKRIDKFYIDQNRPKEVIKLYQDAINKKPNTPVLHFLLGEAYIRFEMFDDAMIEFQKAYTYNPDSIALNLLIGKMFEKKDDFQSASREYHKAFQKELSAALKVSCGKCGYQTSKWVGRCPNCKDWDIKSFDIKKTGQNLLS